MSVRAPVGPVNMVQNQICIGRGLAALRCGVEIFPTYLFHVLHSMEAVISGRSGMAFSSISQDEITKIKIPLPPLDVQQKIVTEIERIENEEQSVLAKIEAQYYDIEHIFDPISVPHTKSLGKLVICNPPKADVPDDTFISFVDMAAVSNDGHIVGAVDRPMLEVRKGSYTYFQENDIIIAKITPCMENGKCALATGLTNGIGMGSSEFHVFRCGDEILPKYLFGYLNRQVVRQAAEKMMTGKSGHRRVPIGFYQQLSIPLPTLSEQKRIVSVIQRAEDQITQLNTQLGTLKAEKDSILKKYL